MSAGALKKGWIIRVHSEKNIGFIGDTPQSDAGISFSLKDLPFTAQAGMEVEYKSMDSYDMKKNAPCKKAVDVSPVIR